VLLAVDVIVIWPALLIVPATVKFVLLLRLRLLPGSMVKLPMEALVSNVTCEAGDLALLMQTFTPPFGTMPVLQLVAVLQTPEEPPIQVVSLSEQLDGTAAEKFALTVCDEFMVTTQVPLPEQAPDQP
jgi:hypothetical protein